MGKRELAALISLFSWCLVIVVWLFLAVPWVCLQFVIVVFPDQIHSLSNATLANFSTKWLAMCKVYTDVGGIKYM